MKTYLNKLTGNAVFYFTSGKLGNKERVKNIIVEQLVVKPTEDMLLYKCRDHCRISDFLALKEEYKHEMDRFNNLKKYVELLTEQIVQYKDIIIKLRKIAPPKKAKAIINFDDLNLDSDDPLLEVADKLSDPGTPDISERFNIKSNIKKDVDDQKKLREEKLKEQSK
jgi:hypothetical protein